MIRLAAAAVFACSMIASPAFAEPPQGKSEVAATGHGHKHHKGAKGAKHAHRKGHHKQTTTAGPVEPKLGS
jgi:hypothetical protein